MLTRLYIKNIALITEADIEFCANLNVLSGETGSGKSVILDSINFVLGSKADKTMIRYGEDEAMVRAEFSVGEDSSAVKLLSEYDIDCDGTIIISRKFSSDGKGSIKVNGNSVTASMLKSLTQRLVDVHGQSEHFFLLNEDNQLKAIDNLLTDGEKDIKHELSSLLGEKRQIKAEIAALGGDEAERARKLDILSYQINEISSAGIKDGEFEELKTRQNVINNVEKIMTSVSTAKSVLDDDGGCLDGLSIAIRSMNAVSDVGEEYARVAERLEGVITDVQDLSENLADLADNLSFDEKEAEEIDERITLLKGIMKKYGGDEESVLKFLCEAKTQYDALADAAATIDKLEKKLNELDKRIYGLCTCLTKARMNAAQNFCDSVVSELKTLNIPDARFKVDFKQYDFDSANLNSANGSDEISFAFSANKGEPLKPLNKVISGGEMSRFMLAIKTRLKDFNGISTYIFDEIDAGISGFTAKTVAEKFVNIAKTTQIIAVSHLPQVCAASDSQYLIYKEGDGEKTYTRVKRLSDEEKVDEIVRLTGNINSAAAKQNAQELINSFK